MAIIRLDTVLSYLCNSSDKIVSNLMMTQQHWPKHVVDKLYTPDNIVLLWLLYPYRVITLGSVNIVWTLNHINWLPDISHIHTLRMQLCSVFVKLVSVARSDMCFSFQSIWSPKKWLKYYWVLIQNTVFGVSLHKECLLVWLSKTERKFYWTCNT